MLYALCGFLNRMVTRCSRNIWERHSVRLRNIRLANAEEALKNTSSSASEIAYLCGFRTISTFSKAFKEKYGENPTTYGKKV